MYYMNCAVKTVLTRSIIENRLLISKLGFVLKFVDKTVIWTLSGAKTFEFAGKKRFVIVRVKNACFRKFSSINIDCVNIGFDAIIVDVSVQTFYNCLMM